MRIKKIFSVVIMGLLVFGLLGCDAFVRKFTRKPKKGEGTRVRPVLAPKEYKSTMTPEELYGQYFLFWKGWQDELIQSLLVTANYKKQSNCVEQAIANLLRLRAMLIPAKQQELDKYIGQLEDLGGRLGDDPYGTNSASSRLAAERIKMEILKDFSYSKVKDYLA